jgi:hypothetical protein
MKIYPLFLLYLLMAVFPSAWAVAEAGSITVAIDHSDGGKKGQRHLNKLISFLNDQGCSVVPQDRSDGTEAELLFKPQPVSRIESELAGFRLIARAETLQGEQMVRGAVLVHGSTGIDRLESLQGQRFGFVGQESYTGYRLHLPQLSKAGIEESWKTFFFVGNHIGVLSMLLHSDADVAVVAEPLARQWGEYNNLAVVSVTEAVETGGWWMRESVTESQAKPCVGALGKLDKQHMKALPAWIGGFDIDVSGMRN